MVADPPDAQDENSAYETFPDREDWPDEWKTAFDPLHATLERIFPQPAMEHDGKGGGRPVNPAYRGLFQYWNDIFAFQETLKEIVTDAETEAYEVDGSIDNDIEPDID